MKAEDVKRYEKQTLEYNQTGEFTLEDGTSSSQLKPKMKKIIKS